MRQEGGAYTMCQKIGWIRVKFFGVAKLIVSRKFV